MLDDLGLVGSYGLILGVAAPLLGYIIDGYSKDKQTWRTFRDYWNGTIWGRAWLLGGLFVAIDLTFLP